MVFGRFRWPVEGLVLVRLVRANPLIWADSACWTGCEILTVLDEWNRVKMAVVC